MISNGKLRSAEHRVVANKNEVRNSVALFIQPTIESIIEPAKALVNAENPAVYKSVRFADFLHTFRAAYSGHIEDVLEPYLLTT